LLAWLLKLYVYGYYYGSCVIVYNDAIMMILTTCNAGHYVTGYISFNKALSIATTLIKPNPCLRMDPTLTFKSW